MLRRDFIGTGALAAAAQAAQVHPATVKNCIFLLMVGGPSQLDTFDPKPDAPANVRSPFRAIRTAAPEIQISELFPRLALQAKKFSLIRSMHYPGELLHDEGMELALTGRLTQRPAPYPPPFPAPKVRDVERYGKTIFGDRCHAARAAVESGVRNVIVPMFDSILGTPGWDMHGYSPFSSFATYRDSAAPVFDNAASALIQDLDDCGLLADTFVVTLSEFGRAPRMNPTGGRDHWTKCWTTLIAGGGIEGGQILGTSDAYAAEPRDNPMTPAMLLDLIGSRPNVAAPVT